MKKIEIDFEIEREKLPCSPEIFQYLLNHIDENRKLANIIFGIVFENEMKEIEDWNRVTFKNATKAGQLMKLEEELLEAAEASEDDLKHFAEEQADVWIVLAGLRRFNSAIGHALEISLKKNSLSMPETKIIMLGAILRKMDINKSRKWGKPVNGLYKHATNKKN